MSVVFLGWAFINKRLVRPTVKDMGWLGMAGICLIANQIFLFKGLEHTTATNAALIFSLSPLFTAGLAALFLKEKITWRMVLGCLVAIAGLFQVLNIQGRFAIQTGDWMILGASFTFCCNLIFVRVLSRRLSSFHITVYTFVMGSLFFGPFTLALSMQNMEQPLTIWGLAVFSVLIGQGLTSVLWNQAMIHVGAASSAIVLNLQPLMTLLLEAVIFERAITVQQMAGVILVFLGVVLSTMQRGAPQKSPNEKANVQMTETNQQ